ncbi:MAG: hypothetical protein KGI04_04040 [Candidatus Micrarchaeota archaeon]|nr:hypothetical protein [Candidatus Micrarchaeota archaeon]
MGLISLIRARTSSYYGKRAYRYVDKLLKDERNLLIISPYIDDYYAAYLARHASGRKRYIISSSIRGSAAKKLQKNQLSNSAAATFLAVSVNSLLFLIGGFSALIAFFTIAFGAILVAYSLAHRNRIYLKVPKEFVHVKMYVGERVAIEGSANLTYAGMHKNIETVRLIRDQRAIDALKRQFWTMWNSL